MSTHFHYFCAMKDNEQIIESNTLGFHLDRAFTSMVGELNKMLYKFGLPINHSHFVILQILDQYNGISQNDIARLLGKDSAAISRSLKYLETNGFVTRKAISGCKNGVYITEKTIGLRPTIEKVISMVTTTARGRMSEQEYQAGINFLTRIYKSINKQ